MFKAISKKLKGMQSENWGGLASMSGSLVALTAGDIESLFSTTCFFASEISFARKGHTSGGYSLGCAGLSVGDGALLFSHATAGNPALQATMAALTGVWAVGALRYPIEQIGKVTAPYSESRSHKIQKTADTIPPLVGGAALMLRLPALYTAAFAGTHINGVMLACNTLWATADILLGRVQNFVKGPVKSFAIAADHLTGNNIRTYVVKPTGRMIKSVCKSIKPSEPNL